MAFTTLTDEQEKELWRPNKFYFQEAKRCESAKPYLAGCVMLGSALETGKASGTCTAKGNADGSTSFDCMGTYAPAAK